MLNLTAFFRLPFVNLISEFYINDFDEIVIEVKDMKFLWDKMEERALNVKEVGVDGTNYHKFDIKTLLLDSDDKGIYKGLVTVPQNRLGTFINNLS